MRLYRDYDEKFIYLCVLVLCFPVFGGGLRLVDLKCDYRVTPLAVDREDPVL